MPKDDFRYVGHMVDCARRARQFIAGKSRAEFDSDELLRLGVAHLLQTIGEAARLVSEDVRSQHPQVPWTQIVAMRHRIVHDYLNVDFGIVWEVVQRDIPELIRLLAPVLPPSP